ncbi:hypothetical protein MYCTH_2307872 [Thermothelomyces thermophilus ATCC 42464]|uniref:Uncharacterized protein n=1 Tax=Thermothelomyces thermophilus (strain ATCC 42464 / BCRC 31852 / DSM 1799) TaxID=573729 RepID=G2QIH5_THET4|nr:uncharacterized protein MYCTH_2307872 [Thermothelomyces thermophilus ATCC 42464]AEO59507.1 hypothetical protein MYCTH_2307872 [Thermothelomyces thermophilus ATCC 42464]
MFSTDCGTWVSFTGVVYSTQPLDQFVLEVDAAGGGGERRESGAEGVNEEIKGSYIKQ